MWGAPDSSETDQIFGFVRRMDLPAAMRAGFVAMPPSLSSFQPFSGPLTPTTVVDAESAEVDAAGAEVEKAAELFASDSSLASSDDDCGLFDVPTTDEGDEEEEEEDIVLPGTKRFEQLFGGFGGMKAKGRGKGNKASLQLQRCRQFHR